MIISNLTDWEQEVREVVRDVSNAEIGARLFLSEGTMKTHVGRTPSKLDPRDAIHAVVWAYEHRLARTGD